MFYNVNFADLPSYGSTFRADADTLKGGTPRHWPCSDARMLVTSSDHNHKHRIFTAIDDHLLHS